MKLIYKIIYFFHLSGALLTRYYHIKKFRNLQTIGKSGASISYLMENIKISFENVVCIV